MPNIVHFGACGQTVLPDRSVLTGQKLVENAKIEKFKYDNLSNFQTIFQRNYLLGNYSMGGCTSFLS